MLQIAQGILALALCVPTGMFDSLVIFSQSNYLAYSNFEEDNAMDSRQKKLGSTRHDEQTQRWPAKAINGS